MKTNIENHVAAASDEARQDMAAGRETVKVQYLSGGHIRTIAEIESAWCLSMSWACGTIEAMGAVPNMPEWLARIYTPPLAIWTDHECPEAPADEIERVRALATEAIRRALTTDREFAEVVESARQRAIDARDRDISERLALAAMPGTVDQIRRGLARKRVISPERARSIMRVIAPAEDRVDEIITDLRRRDSITIWSPAGGGMRYDQPGTISHTPLIAFLPHGVTSDLRAMHQFRRCLCLRVSSTEN